MSVVSAIAEDIPTFHSSLKVSRRRKGEAILVPSSWLASDTFDFKKFIFSKLADRWHDTFKIDT
jgi:hypothetical protein